MNTEAATEPTPFSNTSAAFVLWYKPNTGRAAWEAVARGETQFVCVCAIGIGGRRNGRWLILPSGNEPGLATFDRDPEETT